MEQLANRTSSQSWIFHLLANKNTVVILSLKHGISELNVILAENVSHHFRSTIAQTFAAETSLYSNLENSEAIAASLGRGLTIITMEISSRGNEYSGRLAPRDRRDYRSSRRRRNLWSIIIMLGTIVSSCVTLRDAYLHAATPHSLPAIISRPNVHNTCLRVTIRAGGRKSEFPSRILVLLSLPIPGVKWVNLARTVQSRHRHCASKSNWNIGNALPFRFHDFCSPSFALALPSSMCNAD